MRKTISASGVLLAFYFCLCGLQLSAQKDTGYFYLNHDLQNTQKDMAAYFGIAVKEDGLWHLRVFHLASGNKVLSGYYKDSLVRIPEGLFQTFYDGGKRKAKGYYHNAMKGGWWKEWDEAGHLTDSIFFENSAPKYEYEWHYNEANVLTYYEYLENDSAKSYVKVYDDRGRLLSERNYRGRAHTITRYVFNGAFRQVVRYDENGNVISSRYFKRNGKELSQEKYEKKIYWRELVPEYERIERKEYVSKCEQTVYLPTYEDFERARAAWVGPKPLE